MVTTAEDVRDKVSESPGLEIWSRIGLASRGALHLVVAALALRVATGDFDEKADAHGALATVAEQPFGRVLMLAAAAGFAGYAVWRFVQAVFDPDDKGADAKGVAKRASYVARGLLYVVFTVTALDLALGGQERARGEQGGSSETQDLTARALELPAGRWLVAAAALVVIAIGLFNGWRAVTRGFEKDLKRYEMTERQRCWTTRFGVVGHLARMVAFLVVGGFLVRAAVRIDPQEGVGLDASLHEVAARSYGPVLLAVVAIGLVAFGLYQLVQARYRRVLED